MEKYKKYSITFNEGFFNSLGKRWLTNIEVFLLLNNIEELIKNNFIKLSSSKEYINGYPNIYSNNNSIINTDTNNNNDYYQNGNDIINKISKKWNYFIIPFSEYGNIPKDQFTKANYNNIQIKTIDKVKVINSSSGNVQRRFYFLIDNPKYIFIHYRSKELTINNNKSKELNIKNNINEQLLEKINFNSTLINIINFNPDSIEEDKENQKLFIIIKSKFTIKELNYLIPFLSISFGNKFVKYEVISDNVLSCYIPPQKKKEVIIDIYYSNKSNGFMNKISFYEQKNKKSFIYKCKYNIEENKKNNNTNNNIFNSITQKNCNEIKTYKIFNYGIREIVMKVKSLFNYFLSHINFYMDNETNSNSNIDIENSNTMSDDNNIENNNIETINNNDINIIKKSEKIDISLIDNDCKIEGRGFYEINVNILLEKILVELKKINKIELINYCDEDGYNLLHYLAVLNFSKSLILLNNNKLDFTERSKDNLTVYEICAGKRNLDSLLTIIEIMENKDNEKEKNWYDLNVYKSALFLFLEKQESDYDDVQILNSLLKQIKIKYIIDSTSEKLIDNVNISNTSNNINKGEEMFIDGYTKRNIRKIQKAVKSWLKRNKYKSLHKTANTLIEKMKESCEGKGFSKKKNIVLFIQYEIRKWLKEKHKKKNKEQ